MASSLSILPTGAIRTWPVTGCAVRATMAVPLASRDQRVLPVPATMATPATLPRPQQPLPGASQPDPPGVEVDDIPFCNDAAVLTDDLARPVQTAAAPDVAQEPPPDAAPSPTVRAPPAPDEKAEAIAQDPVAPPDDPAGPWAESLRILRQPGRDPTR